VRSIREAQGLSSRQLALRANVSPPYMWRIEKAERDPSPDTIQRIADALGVGIDAISYPAVTIHVAADEAVA